MDPVDSLPPEVSSEIIAYASLANCSSEGQREVISVDLLLDLTLVCTSWRDLIFTIPELWADIVIDGYTHDLASKLILQCELSRQHPLSLTISSASTELMRLLLPVLSTHTQRRIQDLYVSSDSHLHAILSILEPLPHLLSLEIGWTVTINRVDEATISFISKHPYLKFISGIHLDVKLVQSSLSWLPCLREVVFDASLHQLKPYLDSLSNVQKVQFNFSKPQNPIALESYKVYSLPRLNWTQLTVGNPGGYISFHFWQNIDVLVPSLTQSLGFLVCTLDFRLFGELLPHLADFVRLIHLGIFLNPSGELNMADRPIRASGVTMLWIEVDSRDYNGTFMSLLPIMILRCFRNTTSVHLAGWPMEQLRPLLSQHGLPQLREVTLRRNDDSEQDFALSPTIQVFRIYGLRKDLRNYSSEDVQELSYNFYDNSDSRLDEFDPRLWPCLTRLSTAGCQHINWMGASLTNLGTIALINSGSRSIFYQGTRLIYFLALYPHTFPSLVKLELRPYIEWDIFFCFLEARNAQMNEPYARMQTIVFHEDIPFGFLEFTSKLLFGDKVDRPSNFELSWIGNLDLLHNSNLPGCLGCIKTLRRCEEKLMPSPDPDSSHIPTFSSYPSTNREVLLTWPAREAEWDQYSASHQKRISFCHCSVAERKATITRFGYYVR